MMHTVKEIFYTVGDSTGAFAKSLGIGTKDLAKTVGTGTKDLAKTVGTGAVAVAKDIGPKRALIGAAILAAAIAGGIVLVRYLRRREQAEIDEQARMNPLGASRADMTVGRADRRAVQTQGTLR